MMKAQGFTKDNEQCLRNQAITDTQPGPVLTDFRTMLDFVGTEGLEAGGKYHLFPLQFITELNARLSRPLKLVLKRPQLRSHPYLQGLHLLLRASGLVIVEGLGAKARLVVDSGMLVQWDSLNPTEQYFNLLEAWLRFGRDEMVGERERASGAPLLPFLSVWHYLPNRGGGVEGAKTQQMCSRAAGRTFYHIALMDLFGFSTVEHPNEASTNWVPAGVRDTPFGEAALGLIASRVNLFSGDFSPMQDDEDQDDDAVEEELEIPRFGAWQPLFQPYFPEWRQNLELPEFEPRDGAFIFRVSLGKTCWRLIAMPADATLGNLVGWILNSVNFDHDHLYEITYRDRMGVTRSASHPAMDEPPYADNISIGSLPLEPGQSMDLLYDFGDNWQFKIKLERVEPPSGKAKPKAPRILEKHGKSPVQYAQADDW